MLDKLDIDGFRSLVDFSITLTPGLNVIVGSNGSGKTNFVNFLDFLAELVEVDVNSAIAVAQGAGSVFSKEKFSEDTATLTFKLEGTFDTSNLKNSVFFFADEKESEKGTYIYQAKISYLKDIPAVIIASEEIQFTPESQASFVIHRKTTRENGQFETHVNLSPRNHKAVSNLFRWNEDIKNGKVDINDYIAKQISPEKSIVHIFIPAVRYIMSAIIDMTSFRSVNIDPSIARRPTPVGVREDIGPKGERLAGALYRLKQGTYASTEFRVGRRYIQRTEQKNIYDSVLSWCKEVNPEVDSIKVELDFQEALFRPYLTLNRDEKKEDFSLTRMSDGTVKWLALLSVMHVEANLCVIEEPENFLHPFMQESFIMLCKNIIDSDKSRNFIISTHSPTLLDFCDPRDMIIFQIEDGLSKADRVANHTQLSQKIQNSRFGLGHYYRTGGVYGTDRRDR